MFRLWAFYNINYNYFFSISLCPHCWFHIVCVYLDPFLYLSFDLLRHLYILLSSLSIILAPYIVVSIAFVIGCNWPCLAVVTHIDILIELGYYIILFFISLLFFVAYLKLTI
jgi:hypothetical protein